MDVLCPLCRSTTSRELFRLGEHSCLRCLHCELQFLEPQPSDEALKAVYDKDYYSPWLRDSDEGDLQAMKLRTFRRHLRLLRRHTDGGRLLDVGCALGAMLRAAKEAGFTPFGVELNPAAVERARQYAEDVRCGTLQDARYDPETFDAVTITDVLEHTRDPGATLREAGRVLRPGGVLLVTTPNAGTLAARLLGRHWPHYKIEHLFYFNRKSLRLCLADFEILTMRPATKSLGPLYFGNILRRYASLRVIRAVGAASAAFGRRIWDPHVPVRTGELLVIARRPSQGR